MCDNVFTKMNIDNSMTVRKDTASGQWAMTSPPEIIVWYKTSYCWRA